MKRANWLISGVLLATFASISLFAGLWISRQNDAIQNPYSSVGGEFTLASNDGPVSLSDFQGRVVLLFFGYTQCPDVCPTDLARMSAAFSELTITELNEVRGMFVSVDPERDTLDKVSKYASFFHKNIIGLTGSPDEIRAVADKYFVAYQKISQEGSARAYTLDHSATTFLIGRNGQVMELLQQGTIIDEIVQSIRTALDG